MKSPWIDHNYLLLLGTLGQLWYMKIFLLIVNNVHTLTIIKSIKFTIKL